MIEPNQLSIIAISELSSIDVHYWEHSSAIAKFDGLYKVFINDHLNNRQRWQDFGHEMKHYFYDDESYGSLKETYAKYGESKADYFAYHFCVPTFMLMKIKGVDVYDVMRLFNVEFDFALRRLEMYRNKVIMKGESNWQKGMQDTVEATSGNWR